MSILKKAFHTGLGYATTATETLKTRYNDVYATFEKQQQEREEAGEKVLTTMQKNVEAKYTEVRDGIKERVDTRVKEITGQVNATMDKLNIPTTDAFKVVERRMKSLEKKIGDLSKELEARQS